MEESCLYEWTLKQVVNDNIIFWYKQDVINNDLADNSWVFFIF